MNHIVLFDGECNFCDASVQFIIKNNSRGVFKFASLQGEMGQRILKKYNVSKDIDSFLLVADGKVYSESSAALRVAKELKGFWKTLYLFIIFPPSVRDFLYKIVAKNRYKWFGRKESCMMPSTEISNRFLIEDTEY